MESVLKSEILEFLLKNKITPRADHFKREVTNFCLRQFGVWSYQYEENSYERFENDVQRFQESMISFSKTKNDQLLKKHKVRIFSL